MVKFLKVTEKIVFLIEHIQVFIYLYKKSSHGLQIKQCLAVHYFNRASTDKQFCPSIVGLVETLTVELVEALGNLHLFFSMKAKLDFLTSL